MNFPTSPPHSGQRIVFSVSRPFSRRALTRSSLHLPSLSTGLSQCCSETPPLRCTSQGVSGSLPQNLCFEMACVKPLSRRVIHILAYGYRFAILSRFTDIYLQRAKRVIRPFRVFTRLHCKRFAQSVLACLKTVCVNSCQLSRFTPSPARSGRSKKCFKSCSILSRILGGSLPEFRHQMCGSIGTRTDATTLPRCGT